MVMPNIRYEDSQYGSYQQAINAWYQNRVATQTPSWTMGVDEIDTRTGKRVPKTVKPSGAIQTPVSPTGTTPGWNMGLGMGRGRSSGVAPAPGSLSASVGAPKFGATTQPLGPWSGYNSISRTPLQPKKPDVKFSGITPTNPTQPLGPWKGWDSNSRIPYQNTSLGPNMGAKEVAPKDGIMRDSMGRATVQPDQFGSLARRNVRWGVSQEDPRGPTWNGQDRPTNFNPFRDEGITPTGEPVYGTTGSTEGWAQGWDPVTQSFIDPVKVWDPTNTMTWREWQARNQGNYMASNPETVDLESNDELQKALAEYQKRFPGASADDFSKTQEYQEIYMKNPLPTPTAEDFRKGQKVVDEYNALHKTDYVWTPIGMMTWQDAVDQGIIDPTQTPPPSGGGGGYWGGWGGGGGGGGSQRPSWWYNGLVNWRI